MVLELACCSFCPTLRGSNRYGRSPECSTGTTEFSTSLSFKFTKFESFSSNKLSSELPPILHRFLLWNPCCAVFVFHRLRHEQTSFGKRFPWSPSCETSKNILNARFVSIPTTNPKRYHVYTHFAVSVCRIMQEPATDKESSVVQSVKPKSICPKEIVSTVYRPVSSTTVC